MKLEERMALLVVKIAHAECDSRMTGPEGPGYMFCAPDYPEQGIPSGYGDNELEAAITFLEEFYQ